MPATSATHAYAKAASAHTDFEKGKKLLSAIDKKKDWDKWRAMQGDINMVLQSTPGDKSKAAKEAKEEEIEFSAELDNLGLGGTAKAHHTAARVCTVFPNKHFCIQWSRLNPKKLDQKVFIENNCTNCG